MQMPVDIKAVLEAITNTQEAANTSISVTVFLDDSSPAELIAHVRSAFASAGANAKVTISYIDGAGGAYIEGAEDIAVIVAGVSEHIGARAAQIRAAGVPVMVVTTMPKLVEDMAASQGSPIPEGDLVFPSEESSIGARVLGKVQSAVNGANGDTQGTMQELIELDNDALTRLDMRMGKWIISTCEHHKLAFAAAFPFVRQPLAIASINATSLQNAAVGFVPFIPGADMPIMTLNQVKMLLQIAAAYNQPLDTSRIKELVALLGGAYASRQIVRSATKVVPGAGWLISGAIGYSATEAFGRAAIEYFEAGGDLKGVANVVEKATSAGTKAASAAMNSPVGKTVSENAKQVISQFFSHKVN